MQLNNIVKEPIVAFHGNTKHFDIANSYIYTMDDKKEKILLPFNGNNGNANASQYNVVRTLRTYFAVKTKRVSCFRNNFWNRGHPVVLQVQEC